MKVCEHRDKRTAWPELFIVLYLLYYLKKSIRSSILLRVPPPTVFKNNLVHLQLAVKRIRHTPNQEVAIHHLSVRTPWPIRKLKKSGNGTVLEKAQQQRQQQQQVRS